MAPTTNELAFASSRPPSPLPELDDPTLEDELDLDKDLQDIGETEQVRASHWPMCVRGCARTQSFQTAERTTPSSSDS